MPKDAIQNIKDTRYLGWVWFYGISTIAGYLIPNPLYTYIKYICFGLARLYGISTFAGYLMPNPLNTNISNIYVLVWTNFMGYQPLQII